MRRFLARLRNSVVKAVLGVDVRANTIALQEFLVYESTRRETEEARFARWEENLGYELAAIRRKTDLHFELLKHERDDITTLRLELEVIRRSLEYSIAMSEPRPLVTVRIASYLNTDALMDIALPSVLRQTYTNFEIVVVNDGPNERTRRALEELAHPRIRYEELSVRSTYPEDPHWRWMVAGSPGMNRGANLARGAWIAPLDDDDEFTPDHLEKLVALALEQKVEVAYGALIQRNLINGDQNHIFSYPPAISQFSFQGAVYLARLHPVFQYDEQSWLVEEPGDWNLIRRMSAAGVTMAATPEVVAIMNHIPYTHKGGELEAQP